MDLKNCRELINRMEHNLYHLESIRVMSFNMYEKIFYDNLIRMEKQKINVLKKFLCNMEEVEKMDIDYKNMRQQSFTLEELKKYDGKNGNKAYIAIDGIVYDVTYNAAWAAGTHFGLKAGNDLSNEISSCHNKELILKGLEQVGILKSN